jgi:peptidoglycan hydrolase-like protein with peptidoglycan-binding domain
MKSIKLFLIISLLILIIPLGVSADGDHFTRSLASGSTGNEVKDLQIFLTIKGFLPKKPTAISGSFGSKTKAALIKYQKSVGTKGTGKVDSLTRTLLNADILTSTLSDNPLSRAFKVPLIKMCPEEKIENIKPGPVRYHYGSTTASDDTGYYIFKGERREISEFDATWLHKNCQFPVNIVY